VKAKPLFQSSFSFALLIAAAAATSGCGQSNDASSSSSSEPGPSSSTHAASGSGSSGSSGSPGASSSNGATTASTSTSGSAATSGSSGGTASASSTSGTTGASASSTNTSSGSGSSSGSSSSRSSSSSSSASGSGEGTLTTGIRAFPAPGATGLCPDPPLRLTFASAPTLGASGKIRVYDASSTATPVATVDMGASSYSETLEGLTYNMLRPAFVDGNDAVVYLPPHSLTYGKTYYVTVDSGAIVGPGGAVSVTSTTEWKFSTAAAAPSSASAGVALDGSQPFCTVQGALDAVPAKNTAAVTITVQAGTYHEFLHLSQKSNVTILGTSRTGTIIEGENNANMNASTQTRSLVGVDNVTGVVFDTLTITNQTPQGGSQAEALRLQSCDKCVVRNANISSLQDTLLWSGRVYATNCTISGNVDFVWGDGVAYFNKCDIHTAGRSGAIVQSRNGATGYGYVFVDSTLTADSSVTGQVLARIDVSAYPASHVAYINCTMGSFIAPVGWTITGGTAVSQLRFWEYQSVDSTGKAIDVSHRATGSTQISSTEAAQMRDPTVVLGGWQPPP
jgi:pectin methylesterase-like acyl-CoA thioesterase